MKSKLKRVTFTGADDTIEPSRLVALSAEYAMAHLGFDVEWGILIGSQSGHRFPSRQWMEKLASFARPKVKLSLHICGAHLRGIAAGKPLQLPKSELQKFQRCQLNWHGENKGDIARQIYESFKSMESAWTPEVIFQLDGTNNGLALDCFEVMPRVAGLYDLSHGAGVLPDKWPDHPNGSAYPIGFAGGLGPDNLREELPKIAAAASGDYWIDMETKVFTGLQFDIIKCCEVLDIVADFVRDNNE